MRPRGQREAGLERQRGLDHGRGKQAGRGVTSIEAAATVIFKILANPQRHMDFDGSGMLRGADLDRPVSDVGDTFTMKMHRLGDDYLMLNYVVEFERLRSDDSGNRLPETLLWAENDDPAKVGIPAGYRWGYILTPDGDHATVVTEVFDPGRVSEKIRQALLHRWRGVDQREQLNGAKSDDGQSGEAREDQYRVGPLLERVDSKQSARRGTR